MKPSVTKLIDLLDKPALLKWANKIGLEGIRLDEYRSRKKESGSAMHAQVEEYAKSGILPDDKYLAVKIQNFFKDKEIISTEESIETDYFVGRFDVKLRWQDFIFICDYKSNSKVYFETKLQLAAYKMASQCDHVGVVHLPDMLIHPITLNMKLYEPFIKHLSGIYELKQLIESEK